MRQLFSDEDLRTVLSLKEKTLSNEINSLDETRILNTSPEDLCTYFVTKYKVEPLQIDEQGIQVDYGDTQVEVTHRFDYAIFDTSRPTYVTGTRISFYIPFTGDPQLFDCRPSRFYMNSLRGRVQDNEILFVYDRTTQDVTNVNSDFERDQSLLREYIDWSGSDIEQYNSSIREKVDSYLSSRRQKLLRDRGTVEGLGYPLKRRAGVPRTYVTPEVRRRIPPQFPSVTREPYKPDPAIELDEYEHILSVISNMVLVMERSPKAFRNMSEEDLRQHFLVQLNGQYEGQATGETFNYEGKTDILIRSTDRNLFIAECKFWSGPTGLADAINQLLGYTSWRDTKTALLIFNRNRQTSTVLKSIPEVATKHPNYKADVDYDSETGFRYVFSHRDDSNKELTLTVLVFDIPA
ncbi:MAG: hypothetical protein OXI84_00365 [bacterium]|nr:hypothetical protein [bacterium]